MDDYDHNGDHDGDSSEGDNVYSDLSSVHNYYKSGYAYRKDYRYLELALL
jgi:hypothetical protein